MYCDTNLILLQKIPAGFNFSEIIFSYLARYFPKIPVALMEARLIEVGLLQICQND